MSEGVSIVVPAFRAEASLKRAVTSALVQTHRNWELIVVADDAADYEAVLGREGISDQRIRFLATGNVGSGSPPARNLGLEAAQHRYAAILDADDAFFPEKLARCLPLLKEHAIISCALQVADERMTPLRTVGEKRDGILEVGAYKFTNISMDSMLVYDRRVADPRFDAGFPCLTDIDFLLKLFAHSDHVYHLGTPLHYYVKQKDSISNKPGASAVMVETKNRLLALLERGAYPLAEEAGRAGLIAFYRQSLKAEETYASLLAAKPDLLFEDHLETHLARPRD